MNGLFAVNQKWIMDKIIFVGLTNSSNEIKGCKLITGTQLEHGELSTRMVSNENGFVSVEISKLSILIGIEFTLELTFGK